MQFKRYLSVLAITVSVSALTLVLNWTLLSSTMALYLHLAIAMAVWMLVLVWIGVNAVHDAIWMGVDAVSASAEETIRACQKRNRQRIDQWGETLKGELRHATHDAAQFAIDGYVNAACADAIDQLDKGNVYNIPRRR